MNTIFESIKEKINNQPIEQFVGEHGNTELVQAILETCNDTVYGVETDIIERRDKIISSLLIGEWVDTEEIETCLNITFKQGMHLFDFSREVEWNKPPLNGQKVTTKFRLKRFATCNWKGFDNTIQGEETNWVYKTGCGKYIDENMTDSNYKYCPYCSKILEVEN